MRSIAICGSKVQNLLPRNRSISTVEIKGIPVICGLITTEGPLFDPEADDNKFKVLVRIKAFSCNYRDLSLIFAAMTKGAENSFFPAGSDFVGEVLEVGSEVTSVKAGDRVIADNSYYMSASSKVSDGVLTNTASKEYQIFPASKLLKIPDSMPDEIAGAFSIGAQTAYSMVRKLELAEGTNVLVTSARSNTSLFAINALAKYKVNIYATTTAIEFDETLREAGVKEVIAVDQSSETYAGNEHLMAVAVKVGGFDSVIDPFFDLHIGKIIDFIAPDGKYITCGLNDQYQGLVGQQAPNHCVDMRKVLLTVLTKNLRIIGSCLGMSDDLKEAVSDYSSGLYRVVLDRIYSGDEVGPFFYRTFSEKRRFGKVVYKYHDE